MKIIKHKPDLRTSDEWKQWATAKIQNKPRLLTNEEVDEMVLGDCIEFDPADILKQQIIKGNKLNPTPPNYIEKYIKDCK